MLSLNILFIIIILFILAGLYFIVSQNKTDKFHNLQRRYFNNAIYSMPGTVGDPYILYGSSYMPYESAVPAIDILRAGAGNSELQVPAYYKQYATKNITPFAIRNSNTI